jgi:hypothetical protein
MVIRCQTPSFILYQPLTEAELSHKKNRSLSRQPGCLGHLEIRSFPSPPHGGFGFPGISVKQFLHQIEIGETLFYE